MKGTGRLVGLLLGASLILSCGTTHHYKRAKLHILKLEAKGGTWDNLKTVKEVVTIPGDKATFNFTFPTDTVTEFITKDSVRLRIMRITPIVDTARIVQQFRAEIECPPAKVERVIEYKTLDIPKKPFPWTWLFIAVSAVSIAAGIWFIRK